MVVCVVVGSLQGQGRMCCSMVDSASAVTTRAGVEVQNRTPTAARMTRRNMISSCNAGGASRFRSGDGRCRQR